jgi:NAD dependent epimerase/dehydratase family enzyme
MKIVITGGSGLVGRALQEEIETIRNNNKKIERYYTWKTMVRR